MGSSECCNPSRADLTGKASCSARGVGSMPLGLRMNRSSFNILAEPGQSMTHRGRAQAKALAGKCHVSFLRCGLEDHERIEIDSA